MTKGLPYYKAYPRDFIEGTIGMSFELKGAYRLILDLIYMQGGSLPDDARYISGLLGCTVRKWNTLRLELISLNKIQVKNSFITNYRAVIELETLRKLVEKQSENRSNYNKNKDLPTPNFDHTEPEPDIKIETKVSTKKGCRIPNGWVPDFNESDRIGLTRHQAIIEADKFRDYWKSKVGRDASKLDWNATWRNWCRNARPSSNLPRASPPYQKATLTSLIMEENKAKNDTANYQTIEH